MYFACWWSESRSMVSGNIDPSLSGNQNMCLTTRFSTIFQPVIKRICTVVASLHCHQYVDIQSATTVITQKRNIWFKKSKCIYILSIILCTKLMFMCRWSEAECSRQQLPATPENKRSVLGRALSLVRFPLMSVEEFAVGAAQSGLLSDREVVSLFLYFTVNPKPAVGFLEVPRCCMTGKEQTVNRFQQIESRWGYSGTSDRIRYVSIN